MPHHASPEQNPNTLISDQREDLPARKKTKKQKPWLLWFASCAVIISGLSYYAVKQTEHDGDRVPDVDTTAALVSPPAPWSQVINPAVLFAFDMPELELPNMSVEARTYREGGREDSLSIGSAADPFYLRIVIDRSQQKRSSSFYIDLVRTAATAGLSVKKTAQSVEYPTKFGSFEFSLVTLAKNTDTSCIAFRGQGLGRLSMHGWLCGNDEYVSHDMLACFIDRLTPTPALRERDLETEIRALDKNQTEACTAAMNNITAAAVE
ncbi:hypothetical protein WJT86_00880 [Microvirga sp. W0021]|uniref:Transmembrane protein n=1 Tax=Hohaiivirga grylli TaxID=3133970 RepID=A0ABV0BF55_9HYPH